MSSEHQELLRIFQSLDDYKKNEVLNYARNLAGDTESGPPGPESHDEEKAGTQPPGSSRDAEDTQKQNKAETNAVVPEKSQNTTLQHQSHNIGELTDNYDVLVSTQQQFKDDTKYPSWSNGEEVSISQTVADTFHKGRGLKNFEHNEWKKEIEHMASNHLHLFMTQRCLLLDQNISEQIREDIPISFGGKKGVYSTVQRPKNLKPSSTTLLQSLPKNSLIEIYGLKELSTQKTETKHTWGGTVEEEWKVVINGTKKTWKHKPHPFANEITSNMQTHLFRYPKSNEEKMKQMAFVAVDDESGEEVVYGSITAYEKMTPTEKDYAKFRGTIIQRNNLLVLDSDSYKNYFACFPEDTVRIFKNFYFAQSAKHGEKQFENEDQYWTQKVLTGNCKHAQQTLVGHLWQRMVMEEDCDILMSEALCLPNMQEFAARVLSRVSTDTNGTMTAIESFGFTVEPKEFILLEHTDLTWSLNRDMGKLKNKFMEKQLELQKYTTELPIWQKKQDQFTLFKNVVESWQKNPKQLNYENKEDLMLTFSKSGWSQSLQEMFDILEKNTENITGGNVSRVKHLLSEIDRDTVKKTKECGDQIQELPKEIQAKEEQIDEIEDQMKNLESDQKRTHFLNKQKYESMCMALQQDPENILPMLWMHYVSDFTSKIGTAIVDGNQKEKKIGSPPQVKIKAEKSIRGQLWYGGFSGMVARTRHGKKEGTNASVHDDKTTRGWHQTAQRGNNKPFGRFIDQSAVKPAAPQSTEICFVSDIEGDLDYFEDFVKNSSIIKFVENKFELDFRNSGTAFVFGGDSQDTGIGDIRFVHLLLKFKRKYPKRVFLIIGNRDVNKLRMKAELAEVEKMVECINQGKISESEILKDQFPYWKDESKSLKTFETWCTENKKEFDCDSTNITVQKRNYMRWAFAETLGMHNTFETRKLELQLIGAMRKIIREEFKTDLCMQKDALGDLKTLSQGATDSKAVVTKLPKLYITEHYTISLSDQSYVTNWREDGADLVIDVYNPKIKPIRIPKAGNNKIFETLKTVLPRDEEVIESFEKECDPECTDNYKWNYNGQTHECPKNFMLKYLENADIMTIQEKTVFCHGGISKKNLYKMPNGLCEQDDAEIETIGYGNLKYKQESFKTIAEWCQHLNEWKTQKISEYTAQNGLIKHGGELAAYGLEPLKNHKKLNEESQSVTYTNMLTEEFNGKEIEKEVVDALGKDLDIIATGHQPVFDCPLIIRTDNKLSVTVDTCKSKNKHEMWWGLSNRIPDNVHEVVIDGSKITMTGRLSSDPKHIFACDTDDDLIGKMVEPGDDGKQFWVRFKFSKRSGSGNQYYCVYTKGFANEGKVMSEEELRTKLQMPLPPYEGCQDMFNFECDCCGQTFVESFEHAQSGDATCHGYDATCQKYDATCQKYDATCQKYDATCQKYDATCQGYNDCNYSTPPTGYTPNYSRATEMPYQQNYCMYPVHMMHGSAMYYFSY